MKILIYSPVFYPSLGGIETVISILANEFVDQGHEVKLVSQVPATDSKCFPFEVIRQPKRGRLLKLMSWCDVYFQGGVSIKGVWPLLFIWKPWIVTHQNWYCRLDGRLGFQDYLKLFCTRFSTNVSASSALARQISVPSTVVPNPYCEDIFYKMPEVPRDKELVFLGRLVPDKGVDLLLDALFNLKQQQVTPRLTIIGSGLEETKLRQQTEKLGIVNQVSFAGIKVGSELAKLLNEHKILVVPSRWSEPFGIVALEGIACGCVVVGSEQGGLKEAIGACGVTFPNGDVSALTKILFNLLTNLDNLLAYTGAAESHLAHHKKRVVAHAYLQVMKQTICQELVDDNPV